MARTEVINGKPDAPKSFFSFFESRIAECQTVGRLGTARNYLRTMSSFKHYLDGGDITMEEVTESLILKYENWLADNGVSRNSSSFYIRNLRSVYNKAVERRLVEQNNPFTNVYTGVGRTRKRAVDEDVIARLLAMDLRRSKPLALARDLFVFSYCTRGMAFVDISFLRKSDIRDDTISYVRRKTGQQLNVRLEPCMKDIIRRYETATAASPYIFPIITATDPATAYRQYVTALNYHNRKLKCLARGMGENLSLSSYTARHTWATAARNHNVPVYVISESMGHTSEKTTRIYLASLDSSVIDEANKSILGSLNRMVAASKTMAKGRNKRKTELLACGK